MERKFTKLEPKTVEEAFDELTNYFLGANYYIEDPVGAKQGNAIIVDDIIYSVKAKLEKIKNIAIMKSFVFMIIGIIIGVIIEAI